jgi:hypothetical protein
MTVAGSFPGGDTGKSVVWKAPEEALLGSDVIVEATADNSSSSKTIDPPALATLWVRLKGEPGDSCTVIDDCPDGLICDNGECKIPCSNNDDCPDGQNCVAGVCEPESAYVQQVIWVNYEDNDFQHNGNKIFPGKLSYTDNGNDGLGYYKRHRVYIRARLNTNRKNVPIYFRWFDADDPSSSPIIDPGGANDEDNHDTADQLPTAAYPQKPHWDANHKATGYTDINGVAQVIFQVSFCPGDNFVIAASTNSDAINNLTPVNYYNGNIPSDVMLSPVLEVWRKLWLERDSMGAIATTGDEKNHVVATSKGSYESLPGRTNINFDSGFPYGWGEVDHFEFGTMIVNGYNPYWIIESDDPTFGDAWITVMGDLTQSGNPSIPFSCKLYDDDWDRANNKFHVTLPKYDCTIGTYQNAYNDAYILIEYLPKVDYSDEVAFNLNLTNNAVRFPIGQNWCSGHDVESSAAFWAHLVVSCYQGQTNDDLDPSDETPLLGLCNEYGGAVIYLENIRDASRYGINFVMAHEVGHGSGCPDHPDNYGTTCIFWFDENVDDWGDVFCDQCLNEMRKDANWL